MGYIAHSIFHFSVGACIVYLLVNKDSQKKKNDIILLIIGGIAGVVPDITKVFGDLYGHSVLAIPIFGLILTLIFSKWISYISLKSLWLILSIAVGSHILFDFLGNGVALLLPFTNKEYSFYIINDELPIFVLTIGILVGILVKNMRIILIGASVLFLLYIGSLTVSKLQLELALKKEYETESIQLLLTYPRYDYRWEFMVHTNERTILGSSSFYQSKLIIEREKEIRD